MPAVIADGKMIANTILDQVRMRVQELHTQGKQPPRLAVVLVGKHLPSETYVKRKGEAAARVGIEFVLERFEASATEGEITEKIRELQGGRRNRSDRSNRTDRSYKSDTSYGSDKTDSGDHGDHKEGVSGIIVQMPLPEGLDAQKILREVDMAHDVDVLTAEHFGALALGQELWLPPTPGAVMEILRYYNVDLVGKHVVLVGRGDLVGKPLALMLTREKVTVTICGRASQPLEQYTKQADVIVTAVGRANTITGAMLKPGAVVIDAGVDFVDGQMMGDIEFESVREVASLVTPTPGGVGPVTVAKLLENTVRAETLNSKP